MAQLLSTKKKQKKRSSWTVWQEGDEEDDSLLGGGPVEPVSPRSEAAKLEEELAPVGLVRLCYASMLAIFPIASGFWGRGSKHRCRAWFLSVTLFFLGLAQTGLLMKLSHWRSQIDTALQQKDDAGFEEALRMLLAFTVALSLLLGYGIWLYLELGTYWKESLSGALIRSYVSRGLFATKGGGVENPDERVTETVELLIQGILGLTVQLVMQLVKCLAFLVGLYRLMPESLAVVVALSTVDTLVATVVVGPPMRALEFGKIKREADLRAALLRGRKNVIQRRFNVGVSGYTGSRERIHALTSPER